MFNSTIAASINTLSVGKQVAAGSRSSLLTSHIEFTSGDSHFAVAPNSFQSKSHRMASSSRNGKTPDSDIVFNGQKKETSGVDQNKNLQVIKHHAVMNGSHDPHHPEDDVPNPRVCLYPEWKIHLEWRQIHKIGAGLANLGNTCFMNAVVQCLTYCPPLANYLLHDNDHVAKCKLTGFCMMCELQKHMKRALDHPGGVIKPVYIYQKLKSIAKHFQIGGQEDAHEFLRYVIDNLWKASLINYDGNAKLDPASMETTVINHIFGGYHRSQVVCDICLEKSNTYDHFMDFILDIKNVPNLEKALGKFTDEEVLQNDNAYKCPKCNKKVPAKKKFTVHRPPNVATFQFKRFDYNRMPGGKIRKHVSYPEKLDIRPYMSNNKGPSVLYRLNAVLVHEGPNCNHGHYVCYVRNSNGYWYLMDDATVHQVTLNEVLGQEAYVLFYVRIPHHASNQLKKSMSSISANHKSMDRLKNGTVVHVTSDLPGTPVPRTTTVTKTTSSPAIIRVSSAASNPLVNGTVHNSSSKLPLSQNREKVVFGIRRPEPGMKNGCGKSSTSATKTTPSTAPSNSTKKACLVPYDGDSSESEEERRKAKLSCSKSKAKTTREEEKSTSKTAASAEVPSTTECNKLEKVQKSGENTFSMDQKSTVSSSKKSSAHRTLPLCVNTSDTVTGATKVKSSFPWNVSDASLHSPSVASGSSTNSVNSTADWNVDVLTDKEANNRNKSERLYTGWTVTQNDKSNSDQSKEKGPSISDDSKPVKNIDSINEEDEEENNHSKSDVSLNSHLINGYKDTSVKRKPIDGATPSGDGNTCEIQREKKSPDSSTSSKTEGEEPKSRKEDQSFLGKFRDHSESGDNSFLKSSKRHKSNETEKRKHTATPDEGSASENVVGNVHKSSSAKRESELSGDNETGDHPMPKKCKTAHNEHEKRKSEHRHSERVDKEWKNRKKHSRHSKSSWEDHKMSKRHDHRKYGQSHSHTGSSYISEERSYYNHKRNYFNEKTDYTESPDDFYSTNNDSHKDNGKEFRDNLHEHTQTSQYQKEDKQHSTYSNYKTGESDNSSCSYEMEWVEKTKETVEAERKSLDSCNGPVSCWEKDEFDRHSSGRDHKYIVCWNGKHPSDAVRELQSYSSKGYGHGVNSWDGSASHLEREVQEDFRLSRTQYDPYDEEYDKGKVKKVKKWAVNGRRMHSSYNPFQKAWDNRNGKYQGQSYHQSKSFHRRKKFTNDFRRWNYLK